MKSFLLILLLSVSIYAQDFKVYKTPTGYQAEIINYTFRDNDIIWIRIYLGNECIRGYSYGGSDLKNERFYAVALKGKYRFFIFINKQFFYSKEIILE